jgi:hypothetical protein
VGEFEEDPGGTSAGAEVLVAKTGANKMTDTKKTATILTKESE